MSTLAETPKQRRYEKGATQMQSSNSNCAISFFCVLIPAMLLAMMISFTMCCPLLAIPAHTSDKKVQNVYSTTPYGTWNWKKKKRKTSSSLGSRIPTLARTKCRRLLIFRFWRLQSSQPASDAQFNLKRQNVKNLFSRRDTLKSRRSKKHDAKWNKTDISRGNDDDEHRVEMPFENGIQKCIWYA